MDFPICVKCRKERSLKDMIEREGDKLFQVDTCAYCRLDPRRVTLPLSDRPILRPYDFRPKRERSKRVREFKKYFSCFYKDTKGGFYRQ